MSKKRKKIVDKVLGAASAAAEYVAAVTRPEPARELVEVVSDPTYVYVDRSRKTYAPQEPFVPTPKGIWKRCAICGKKKPEILDLNPDWSEATRAVHIDCHVDEIVSWGRKSGQFEKTRKFRAELERKAAKAAKTKAAQEQAAEEKARQDEERRLLTGKSSFYPPHVKTKTQRLKFVAGLMGMEEPPEDKNLAELRQELVEYWKAGKTLADPDEIDVDLRRMRNGQVDWVGLTKVIDEVADWGDEEDDVVVTDDEEEEEIVEEDDDEDSEDEDEDWFITE